MIFDLFLLTLGIFIVMTAALGVFAIVINRKSLQALLWFFMSLSILVWGTSHFFHLTSDDPKMATFFARMLYVGAVFIPVFFYHFVLSFLLIQNHLAKKIFLVIGYALSALIAYTSITTDLIVIGVSPQMGFPQWLDPGSLHWFLVLHFWVYIFIAFVILFKYMQKQDGVMKRKAIFIFYASLFGFLTGGTNFLPQTIGVYPFGSFVAWIYAIFIAYGVYSDGLKIKI